MRPTILHFIVCDRVHADPMNLHRINVEGLRNSVRSKHVPPFPCRVPFLTTLAIFMGGRGSETLAVRIVDDASGYAIWASGTPRAITFVGNPDELKGVKIFVPGCSFPRPGLYWVELLLSGKRIARQPLFVR